MLSNVASEAAAASIQWSPKPAAPPAAVAAACSIRRTTSVVVVRIDDTSADPASVSHSAYLESLMRA